MAKLFNINTGQPVDVPDEQVPEALSSGGFGLPRGNVVIVGPDGKPTETDSATAVRALAAGEFRLRSQEEEQAEIDKEFYGQQSGRAFVEGAARGVSFGLSDLALGELGISSREGLAKRARFNPAASTVGEVAGAVGGVLAAGPGALVAKGATAAGKLAGGGVVGGLAAGATEGAFYGLGNTISENYRENSQLTAEKLVAGTLTGAAMGGAVSGSISAMSAGVKAAGRALQKTVPGQNLKQYMEEMAEDLAVKQLGAQKGAFKALNRKGMKKELGQWLLENDMANATSEQQLAFAKNSMSEASDAMRSILGQADEVRVDAGKLSDDIEALFAKQAKGSLSSRQVAETMKAEAELIRARGKISLTELEEIKREFQANVRRYGRDLNPLQEAYASAASKLRQSTEDALEGMAGKGVAKDAFIAAKKKYGIASEAASIAEEKLAQLEGNRIFGLSEQLGVLSGAVAGGPMAGAAGALASRLLKTKGAGLGAEILDKAAKGKLFSGVANAFARQVKPILPKGAFGPFNEVLRRAAVNGNDALLAAHMTLASSDPDYREAAAAQGFAANPGAEISDEFAGKVLGQATLDDADEEYSKRVEASIGRFLGTQPGRAPKKPTKEPMAGRLERMNAIREDVDEFLANPDKQLDILSTNGIESVDPAVAAGTNDVITRAANFLKSKAPRPPDEAEPVAMRSPWKPSVQQVSAFEAYVEAVQNPLKILDEMSSGYMAKETVEALQAVYPSLYQDIQRRAAERLSSATKPLDYQRRRALAKLMVESQMMPQGAPQQQPVQPAQQANVAQKKKVDFSKSSKQHMTATERVVGR